MTVTISRYRRSINGDILCTACGGIGTACICEDDPNAVTDDRGVPIQVGDTVEVTHINRDRGAELWMHRGVVIGFGRTRVRIAFPPRSAAQSVGAECLRVVA